MGPLALIFGTKVKRIGLLPLTMWDTGLPSHSHISALGFDAPTAQNLQLGRAYIDTE